MKEMILQGLGQAYDNLVHMIAVFVPRFAVMLIIVVVGWIVIRHAEPILRARVIGTLSTRFHSKVELDGFHVSLLRGFQVSGEGLRLFGDTDPNTHQLGVQPLIGVAEFKVKPEDFNVSVPSVVREGPPRILRPRSAECSGSRDFR